MLAAISSNEEITVATAPLIFASTILSHLVSASVGREGAALQLGGSLGNIIGKIMRLDEKDEKIAVMCGMSACFAALFGTPLAAGIFSLEVISIGIMYYAALVPCLFSAFIGAGIAKELGRTRSTSRSDWSRNLTWAARGFPLSSAFSVRGGGRGSLHLPPQERAFFQGEI